MRQAIRIILLAAALGSLTWVIFTQRVEQGSPEPYGAGRVRMEMRDGAVQMVDRRDAVMGTVFVVEVAAPTESDAREACNEAYRRIHALERAMSTWIPESVVSRVNDLADQHAVEVGVDTYRLLEDCRRLHATTGGTFDPTVGPLIGLWRSFLGLKRIPKDPDIAECRERVGFDRVRLKPASRAVAFATKRMSLDFGGIAKGYAAEEAAKAALAAGATACRVNAGGDMVGKGAPPWSPEGFEVEIRDPAGGPADTLPGRGFHVLDAAVATSGNYERYVEVGGVRYSHIIDPRTGRPVPDAIAQVSVLAKSGTDADALATALVVLGVEEGKALAERLPGVEALFLVRDGDGHRAVATSGFPRPDR